MSDVVKLKHIELYKKIRLISNKKRFTILELTSQRAYTISELSKQLQLAYNKCSDYLAILYKNGLINKQKFGKEVKITSKIKLTNNSMEFI